MSPRDIPLTVEESAQAADEYAAKAAWLAINATEPDPAIEAFALVSIALSLADIARTLRGSVR